MDKSIINELYSGYTTAYIDGSVASNIFYRPQFVSNNYKEGKKVLSSIEDELLACDHFQISVAFITMGGITPLLQTLKELENRGIPGEILTTNYLHFSEPAALEKLHDLKNITLKMYDVEAADTDFHTKGYIFKKEEIYRIIIGSSNMTGAALTSNMEWNTKIVSTGQGEVTGELIEEFIQLWRSVHALEYDDFFETYQERYRIIKKQREIAKQELIPSIEKYKLKPNDMQIGFINNLRKILATGEERALLISATGTGKTYASAFAMRELEFKRVLFLVHRGQLARQTKRSYERVFGRNVSMGLVGAGYHEYEKDYVFATVQTLNREEHLVKYKPTDFDCIILDEAHHSSANSYQKIMSYFTPKLWLGMTATPDKRDDNEEGRNIYEIFHHQIAYEIRLQQAMEQKLLCPFHYFGISDLSMVKDKTLKAQKLSVKDFSQLVCDERVKHIVEQAEYYGYSGERVKGLVFCSRIDESKELSDKFNELGYRTIALNGDAAEEERAEAFERLAMDESDATEDRQPLDYIFSVEILNEGVDIVEVNQVIMLRPTESPIVFIQQLGRGLRKAEGKEYLVVLDFIGNYTNNFMIPVALSGDRTYNADTIRRYVISGNSTIPGVSTIHFDEVAKDKIFKSIDKIRGIKTIIKNSYATLKNRIGRIPYLLDFYENGEVDPLVIVKEYKTYYAFLEAMEKGTYVCSLTDQEKLTLEYLSKTILSGARPYELEILRSIVMSESISIENLQEEFRQKYGYDFKLQYVKNAIEVLRGHFVSNEDEYQKFCHIDVLDYDEKRNISRMNSFTNRLAHKEFYEQIDDIVTVGLRRYVDKYRAEESDEFPFVMYEKYSRRDVSLLMNCGKDLSSTMYGMKRIDDDVFIFVTYHKEQADDDKNYVDGKPDYADVFDDNMIFRWDSQIGKGVNSSYMQDVITAKRKHLLVKKSDAESNFYYMGQFEIVHVEEAQKENNKGKKEAISKVQVKMHHPVRDDLLRYLQSGITIEEKVV
ncbi:MAG: DEAD/DEAH box helicase [Lachnospiraceae bacterium]|nr:DEAD/DEAH box helicase [Lachnospiraceae bacterium]